MVVALLALLYGSAEWWHYFMVVLNGGIKVLYDIFMTLSGLLLGFALVQECL